MGAVDPHQVPEEAVECTGVTAGWCPNCGRCSCPDRTQAMDTPTCPLHCTGSKHAEALCIDCGEIVVEEDGRCAQCEVKHLRAIVEGRSTPPTDAEIAAHAAAGGQWRTLGLRGFGLSGDVLDGDASRAIRAVSERSRVPRRWWALDAEGRPCAWPVVTEAGHG